MSTDDSKKKTDSLREVQLDIMLIEDPAERAELYNLLSTQGRDRAAAAAEKARATFDALGTKGQTSTPR